MKYISTTLQNSIINKYNFFRHKHTILLMGLYGPLFTIREGLFKNKGWNNWLLMEKIRQGAPCLISKFVYFDDVGGMGGCGGTCPVSPPVSIVVTCEP